MKKKVEKMTIYGKSTKADNQNIEPIVALWDEVLPEYPQGELLAIYHTYESDEHGTYTLTIGGFVPQEGYETIEIESGNYYEVTPPTNDVPGVQAAWMNIWQNPEIPRRYQKDFEWYKEDGSIQIYLSIEEE